MQENVRKKMERGRCEKGKLLNIICKKMKKVIDIQLYPVYNPDFCRKISIKYPSSPINTRLGGFVILSDFHGVSDLELGF